MITIGADTDAPNRVNHVVQVNGTLLSSNDRCTIFASIQRTCFKVIKRSSLLVRFVQLRFAGFSECTCYKNHLAHIFTICVLCETLVNLLILLRRYRWVDKVPETNRTVRRACHKLRQTVFVFAARPRHCLLVEAYWMLVRDGLNVMNGATVWVHTPEYGHWFQLGYVPHKHHTIAIKRYCTIVAMVDGAC